MVTSINLPPQYNIPQNEIDSLYHTLDKAIVPYEKKQTSKPIILYHGTNKKCMNHIFKEGFKVIGNKHSKTANGVGELGECVYFTPQKDVANLFGARIIKIKAQLKLPAKATAKKIEAFKQSVYNIVANHNSSLSHRKTKHLQSDLFKNLIQNYMKEHGYDALYCNDFVNERHRKLNILKQKQWGFFMPEDYTIVNVSKKTVGYYLLRLKLRSKQLLQMAHLL